jgi:two-component system, chemotaxis family, response regulator PixG
VKHIVFLKNLGKLHFSGQLIWTTPAQQQWHFYLQHGELLYVTGGAHSTRRWRRQLMVHCPHMPLDRMSWQIHLSRGKATTHPISWDYTLLNLWVAAGKVTPEQAARLVHASLIEALFDVAQADDVTHQIKPQSFGLESVPTLTPGEAVLKVQSLWRTWSLAGLTQISPNDAPLLKRPEELKRQDTSLLSPDLLTLMNGQSTLRDLAVKTQQNLVSLASSIAPLKQLGWVDLMAIADLPAPVRHNQVSQATPQKAAPEAAPKALIACVDDSFLIRHKMKELLTSAGYRFLGIDDALRSIGILLSNKPDLIFLDLMMPKVNGYEICEKLRKLSCFRDTPIVILTGSDGFSNRLRSDFAGASDFLSKPLNAEVVLGAIHKHLGQGSTKLSVR